MIWILAVALMFAVWSSPRSDNKLAWPWVAWAITVTASVLGILVLERGWPCPGT